MHFEPIDLRLHEEYIVTFRRDSFNVSFGTDEDFNVEAYLKWVREKSIQFPDGFVLVFENEKPIGQLELTIREYEGKKIGYVNLYYLIPEKRGLGLGNELHLYALKFFKGFGVNEYHLRVSPSNKRALSFYMKNGMKKVKDEFDGKVIRMKGYL